MVAKKHAKKHYARGQHVRRHFARGATGTRTRTRLQMPWFVHFTSDATGGWREGGDEGWVALPVLYVWCTALTSPNWAPRVRCSMLAQSLDKYPAYDRDGRLHYPLKGYELAPPAEGMSLVCTKTGVKQRLSYIRKVGPDKYLPVRRPKIFRVSENPRNVSPSTGRDKLK